jgi:ribonuclease HI
MYWCGTDTRFFGVEAGCGVFFANESHRIISVQLPQIYRQTTQTAQASYLYAARAALEAVTKLLSNDECGDIKRVVLRTCATVFKGIDTHIWKWANNGYRTQKGRKLDNYKLYQYLHEEIQLLERCSIEVNVWKCSTPEATALAESAISDSRK